MSERVYLDWKAPAPLRPQARAAIAAALEACGNPSSIHKEGRIARALIERAREQVAALVAAPARNVVFTSGGTEANMLALSQKTGAERHGSQCARLLISGIEHSSVLAGGRFPSELTERVAVDGGGHIDLADLRARLVNADGERRAPMLVSLMLANNE